MTSQWLGGHTLQRDAVIGSNFFAHEWSSSAASAARVLQDLYNSFIFVLYCRCADGSLFIKAMLLETFFWLLWYVSVCRMFWGNKCFHSFIQNIRGLYFIAVLLQFVADVRTLYNKTVLFYFYFIFIAVVRAALAKHCSATILLLNFL